MKEKLPRVEGLMFPRLLEAVGAIERAQLPADEASATEALSPLVQALLNKTTGPWMMFTMLAKGSVLFLIDYDEFIEAVGSAGPAPSIELPPLPYPRVAVECHEDVTFQLADVDGNPTYDLELFTINETLQGERWDVCFLLRQAGTHDDPVGYVQMFELYRDGNVVEFVPIQHPLIRPDRIRTRTEYENVERQLGDMGWADLFKTQHRPPDDGVAVIMRSFPIEFAHLVNARGVTSESITVPRAQQRRFNRQRIEHPNVYFVRIGGEQAEPQSGHGDREYRHRWLVRGHWRHFSRGGRTWVRPYIKGPAGAPWKGRPIYVLQKEEVA